MTNDELLARLDERVKGLEKVLDDKLGAILEQTTKTNGRVASSEKHINDLNLWRAEQRGQWKGIAMAGAAVGAAVSGVINYFRQ